MLRSHRPSLRPCEELPRTEGIVTPAHEKEGSEADNEADVKREQVQELKEIPRAEILLEQLGSALAPSVTAEIPRQTSMSKEAAERVLDHWAEREDDGEKEDKEIEEDERPYKEKGMAMEFDADSVMSAADYLAPDEARKGGIE